MIRKRSVVIAMLLVSTGGPVFAECNISANTRGESADAEASPLLDEITNLIGIEFYREDVRERYVNGERKFSVRDNELGDPCAVIDDEIASLNASHSRHYRPDQIDYYEMMDTYGPTGISERFSEIFAPADHVHYAGIGAITTRIDGKDFVANVYHGGPAEEAGLLVGDEILSVDGDPYHQIGSFEGKAGSIARLSLRRDEGGEPVNLDVPVLDIKPNELFVEAVRQSARIIERDGVNVGYVRLWTYARPEITPMLIESIAQGVLSDADVLVLDMRSRWGGAPPDVAEIFLGGAQDMSVIDRDGNGQPVLTRWRKPLVGIIDGGARSGMEVLAYSLQMGGVPLVGERTAGAVLAGKPFILSDHSVLLLAVSDVLIGGKRLEGVGVKPDIEVSSSIAYAAGQDDQLERAIQEAGEMVGN